MQNKLINYINNRIDITQEQLDPILFYFHPLQSQKSELLVTSGQTNQRMYFVVEGCLRIFFLREDGQESTRYFAFEGEFATALVSFITGDASLEFIEATEESQMLYINHEDFYHLLELVPQWEKFYRSYLEAAYVNNTNRLMSFITLDATERYRQLLGQNPSIVRRLPNKLVANYLNISQETLSRLKSKL